MDHFVNLELSGITLEYMSSIDISRWYNDGMSDLCKDYLDQVGFIIQSMSANKMILSIKKVGGLSVGITSETIAQYFQFQAGVNWQILDEYRVEITTPKYIGYQLGRLKKEDAGMVLYRAMSEKDDKFIFESIGIFQSETSSTKSSPLTTLGEDIDKNAIYK